MKYDVSILCDPRFTGGTSAALETDVLAFNRAGLKTAVIPLSSNGFFLEEGPWHSAYGEFLRLANVDVITNANSVTSEVAFFHHPGIFRAPVSNPLPVHAKKTFIVTHQSLFKGDGTMEYDPFAIERNIRRQFGVRPVWAPISGLARSHFASVSPFLKVSEEDWPNTFNTDLWTPRRPKLRDAGLLVIGRHGRPHPDKWPNRKNLVESSLPASPATKIRVMGAPDEHLRALSVIQDEWEVLPFNSEPVTEFLDSLDVFSYFHSPTWVESFGRTIAEAMLMGVCCILPVPLKQTFGPHAHYCTEEEVPEVIKNIRANLEREREAAALAQAWVAESFNTASIVPRFNRFSKSNGFRFKHGSRAVPPIQAARRLLGIKRRNRAKQL